VLFRSDSVAAALGTVGHARGAAQGQLLDSVQTSFMSGFHIACIVAAGVCVVGALGALLLPGRSNEPVADSAVDGAELVLA